MSPITQQLVMMAATTVMSTLIGWMIRWNVLFVEHARWFIQHNDAFNCSFRVIRALTRGSGLCQLHTSYLSRRHGGFFVF